MLSIVVPALNEGSNLIRTVESLRATLPDTAEVLVVDDGSSDGCADFLRTSQPPARLLQPDPPATRLGAAQARNRGARAANGEFIVFADAHIDLNPGWVEPILEVLANPSVGAAAPAISVLGRPDRQGFGLRWRDAMLNVEWLPRQAPEPYPAPLLPGACFCMHRSVFEETGGFDAGLSRWGLEDTELSMRLWTLGYDLCLVPEVSVAHLFRVRHPYAIDWDDLLYNTLRVAWMHFGEERLGTVVEALKRYAGFARALSRLAAGDADACRLALHHQRARDDEAYFRRFGDIH